MTLARSRPESAPVEPAPELVEQVRTLIRQLVDLVLEQGRGPWGREALEKAVRENDPFPLTRGVRNPDLLTQEQEVVLEALRDKVVAVYRDLERRWEQRYAEEHPLDSDPRARSRDGKRVLAPLPFDRRVDPTLLEKALKGERPTRRGRPSGLAAPGAEAWVARLFTMSRLGDQAAASALGNVSRTLVRKARKLAYETLTGARANEYREAFDNVVLRGEKGTAWDEFVISAAMSVRKATPGGRVTEDPRTWDTEAVRQKYLELVIDDLLNSRRDVRAGKVSHAVAVVVRNHVLERLSKFSP